jgi:flagellin
LPQVINTNLTSLNAQRNLSASSSSLSIAMQRLSSGLRVNSAADDAAGLSIADRMQTQVRGMATALRNANDGISMSQVAEGALGSVTAMLQRMRELAVQAANDTNSPADRDSINAEYLELASESRRTLGGAEFNGRNILQSNVNSTFQVGPNTSTELDQITVASFNWRFVPEIVLAIGPFLAADPTTTPAGTDGSFALAAMTALDDALDAVNSQRAIFGAVQNRLDNAISNLMTSRENQTAARSRIMDADYAEETAAMARANILQQAGNAMVAQANQQPQQVMALLRQ